MGLLIWIPYEKCKFIQQIESEPKLREKAASKSTLLDPQCSGSINVEIKPK
jgi:hypothetical protein